MAVLERKIKRWYTSFCNTALSLSVEGSPSGDVRLRLKAGVSGVSLSGSHAENPSNRIPKVRKSVCGFIDYILLVPESVIPGDLIIEFEFFQVQIGIGRDGNVNIFI